MTDPTRGLTFPIGEDTGLLEVSRALLLLQGAVLLATTVEALLFGIAFMGAPGVTFVLSGAAALALLIARARLRPDRPRTARVLYLVEGVILVTFGVDTGLAFFIAHAAPPAVAILTQFALPVAVIALLRRAIGAIATIATAGGA